MSDVIFLQNVRLSFPHIAEPQERSASGRTWREWNADFILPADHPGYAKFMETYGKLAQEKWKEHAQQVMQMIHADRNTRAYGDGKERINKKTYEQLDGYQGMMYITASNKNQMPQIFRTDGTQVEAAMEAQQIARQMYGGCYVNVAIKLWLQDNEHGRGIRCDLIGIQFAGDGEPFGEGAPDVSGMFGATQAPQQTAAPSPAGMPTPGAGAPATPAAPTPQADTGMPGLPDFLK